MAVTMRCQFRATLTIGPHRQRGRAIITPGAGRAEAIGTGKGDAARCANIAVPSFNGAL
jgi:hypothetical protein